MKHQVALDKPQGSKQTIAGMMSDEKYFDDFFEDDIYLSDDIDTDELYSAADDLWDSLDISAEEWDAASADGFLIY